MKLRTKNEGSVCEGFFKYFMYVANLTHMKLVGEVGPCDPSALAEICPMTIAHAPLRSANFPD